MLTDKGAALSTRAKDILNARQKKKDEIYEQKRKEARERAEELISMIFDIFETSNNEEETSKWICQVRVMPSQTDEELKCAISFDANDSNSFHDLEEELKPGNNFIVDLKGISFAMSKINGVKNTPNILKDANEIMKEIAAIAGNECFTSKFDSDKCPTLTVSMKKFE